MGGLPSPCVVGGPETKQVGFPQDFDYTLAIWSPSQMRLPSLSWRPLTFWSWEAWPDWLQKPTSCGGLEFLKFSSLEVLCLVLSALQRRPWTPPISAGFCTLPPVFIRVCNLASELVNDVHLRNPISVFTSSIPTSPGIPFAHRQPRRGGGANDLPDLAPVPWIDVHAPGELSPRCGAANWAGALSWRRGDHGAFSVLWRYGDVLGNQWWHEVTQFNGWKWLVRPRTEHPEIETWTMSHMCFPATRGMVHWRAAFSSLSSLCPMLVDSNPHILLLKDPSSSECFTCVGKHHFGVKPPPSVA